MTIVWDFNGTLLDDMQVCIDCMNIMLTERQLPSLDLVRYRNIFTFPVRDYYLSLGFDFKKEPFEIPAHQFIDLYRANLHRAPLQADAVRMLQHFQRQGFRQIILSAMEQDFLEDTLKEKNIIHYFEKIAGIRNHLGEGKLQIARELVKNIRGKNEKLCLIGDTVHDFEVARESGIECILIANGHQSFDKLIVLDCLVLKDLKELPGVLTKRMN
jgi:phosphoglycolate phosphatase